MQSDPSMVFRLSPLKFSAVFFILLSAGLACAPVSPPEEAAPGSWTDAQKLYDQGKSQEAEKILVYLKTKNPSDPKVHLLLGRIFKETKRRDQAIEELEGVVNLDPQNASAFATLSRLYQSQGLFDQALASALQAKKLDPSGSIYNILGTVYFDRGDFGEAVKNYEKALALEADSAWVYNNLGLVYIQLKRWPEAQAQLQKAIEADPDKAIAHNNLGVVLSEENKYDRALKEFQTAGSLDPHYEKAFQNIVHTQKRMKESKGLKSNPTPVKNKKTAGTQK